MKKKCPVTAHLLESHPEVHLAMFSLLKAGGRIYPHAGPFRQVSEHLTKIARGTIRMHVGLRTPNDEKCYIKVADQNYYWKDGEIVAFDDTYRHEVVNGSTKDRLILFLDVEREMKTPRATRLNQFLIRKIAPLTTRKNSALEQVVTE